MARGIYKRGNVFWIRYADLDGKTIYESSGSDKFRDAEALLIQRKQAIREGKQPEIKRIANHSFKELVEKYLSWINGRQKSARVKSYIIRQLIEAFGNLPLRRFNTAIVEQLQTDLMGRGLKNSSCNKVLNVLKHMFTKAVEWDMVESETLKRVRKVKLLIDDSKRLRYLSKEECQSLINACDKHIRPIVVTALNTGMRKGEILSLKWDNVDLKHGFILLDITKNGERREIPINDTVRQTLQSLTRRLDVPYVFYDPIIGKPYQNVKRSFNTTLRRAGIRDFHFHDLRHTFASHLVMAGVDITTVKELLGHKTLTMTLRYSHLAPAHKVKAVDILDNALNDKLSSVGERFLDANYTKTIQSAGVR
ncbi:MAG: site-specific integrase [Nitrospirota bacterium]